MAFVILFGALFYTNNITKGDFTISWLWSGVGVLLVIAALLLAFTTYLTRYQNKKRIVTNIP